MVWFTSDFHIGDERQIAKRSLFSSLDQMESELINRFNSVVSNDDDVWLLGDMVNSIEDALRVIPQLNGKKSYVIGNHDRKWIKSKQAEHLFSEVEEMKIIIFDGYPITLCHYPMYQWYKSKYDGVLIHGHMHSELINLPFYTKHLAFDVSVDKTGFFPVCWNEIRKRIEIRTGV